MCGPCEAQRFLWPEMEVPIEVPHKGIIHQKCFAGFPMVNHPASLGIPPWLWKPWNIYIYNYLLIYLHFRKPRYLYPIYVYVVYIYIYTSVSHTFPILRSMAHVASAGFRGGREGWELEKGNSFDAVVSHPMSSSVGMMTFPTEWKVIKFHVPNHQPVFYSDTIWSWYDIQSSYVSMDWFTGKFVGQPHISLHKKMVSCNCSLLKPIHWM